MKMISEFTDHDRIEGQFLLGSVSKGVNTNGGSYFSVELRDASGQITAKKWDATLQDEEIFVTGNVISLIGETNRYKDALQLKILSAEVVPLDEIDVDRFVKAPPVSKNELIKKFNDYVNSIKNEDCQKLLKYMINKFDDKLYSYPAAVSIHHEYSSGLLMHSLSMADLASFLCPIYDCDYDILITGCLLHDMGKIIELEGPMCAEIRKAADELKITSEVPLLLEHMILSHHGQPEFGSPVMPLTKEALLLSLIDNLDSKMVVVNKAIAEVEPGNFSNKVFPLDNRSFYKPKK